ncbi:MAG: hypothetical protein ACREJ5_29325 [Geminicoccaceae bacterium]
MLATRLSKVAWLTCALLGADHGNLIAAELSDADRKTIEELLGAGVLGEAVAGEPLSDKLAGLHEGTWIYEIVSGKNQGQTEAHVVTRLKRDDTGASWRYEAGPKDILFLRVADDGIITMITEQDVDEGVVIKYTPGQPLMIPDLAPGQSRQFSIGVKVYDLSHPDHLEHSGKVELTYSYLGDYRVAVPAGSYSAALIKWSYKGKIWLANIEDTQYRFVTPDVGIVASIDKEDISALLVYQDHSKTGLVLQKGP